MNLLPDKKSSELLQKAWDLDQAALLKTKKEKRKKLLWGKAISICKNLLKKFPKEINLLTKIATIYQHQKKFNKARYYLYKAKKYHSNNFLVYFYLGNLYRAKDNPTLALKYYKKSLKLSKNNEVIKKALEDYQKFLEDGR